MTQLPEWLASALPPAAHHPGLAIARLGDAKTLGRGGFAMTSPAFDAGEQLDPCFTAKEEDAVAPPLEWSAPPAGSQELIIIAEDATGGADASGDPACHWLVWGLPGQRGKLLEGEVPPRTGKNAQGNSEWLLPNPPLGETRHYVFQMFATELPMTLMPGASREEVIASIEGSITGCTVLHAPFTGTPADEWADASDDPEAN
ncbi:MAG: YbhB/YbcL family Raf kinase inhibitor-like protein [Erythrobacter sp.]|uniref:YbhB/YbcL family Raf kinase inhibitor-like protein n=1 Tax=Erythrobacter sp. TaxID=1042 RepID=UPI003C78BF84